MISRKSKWIWGCICLFVFTIIIFAYIFREAILFRAGRFMAPVGDYQADVAILEGSEFVQSGILACGRNLLFSGKVRRIVIVLQNVSPAYRPYGINENYPDNVRQKLKNDGLKETEFKVIIVPSHQPITLKEAEVVLSSLSKRNAKSAILLSPGFHTRRSYLAYQYAGIPLQIKIFPHACFTEYQFNNWWDHELGVRDFTYELLKLVHYLIAGYIPFKFSY